MSEPVRDFIVISSGTSMHPLIRDGMRVTLRPTPPNQVDIGDIVAFPGDGATILHRIVRKRGNQWLEKGDNRRTGSWIEASTCIGKAITCEDGSVIRALDVPAKSWRLRTLALLSLIESSVFGFALKVAPALSRAGRLASWLTAPLRLILGAPLLSVYPSRPREEDESDIEELVRYFRTLTGPVPAAAPLRLAGLLASHGLDSIAAVGREDSKAARYRAGFLFMNALATLADVQRVMVAHGIPYAILKGPPLAHSLYGDGSLRASVDLDVLVEPGDRDRAAAALTDSGFRARGSKLQQVAVKRGHFHLVFDPQQKGRLTVELHWALVDRANLYRIDESEIRARWTTARIKDLDVGVLVREDELLYLLLHIAKHGLFNGYGLKRGEPAAWFCRAITGNRLIWFLDVQKFLEKFGDSLDWRALRKSSNRWNILDEIFQSLEVLDRLQPDSVAAAALIRLGHDRGGVAPAPSKAAQTPTWVMRWMKADRNLVVRPARLLTLGQLLFPTRRQLKNFYRGARCPLTLLRVAHPFRMMVRLVSG